MTNRITLIALPAVLLLMSTSALADRQSARDRIAESRALISAAESLNANRYALADIKAARDYLSTAQSEAENRNFSEAEDAAARAVAEAKLASARSRAMVAEASLAEIEDAVSALRRELER